MTSLMQFFASKLTEEDMEMVEKLGYGNKTIVFKTASLLFTCALENGAINEFFA